MILYAGDNPPTKFKPSPQNHSPSLKDAVPKCKTLAKDIK